MHETVATTFDAFIRNYISEVEHFSVLEVGSANVNGGLRDHKLPNMDWVGVDLVNGSGVDHVIKVGDKLPFNNNSFDLLIASSVFEHDVQFWNTFLEMARVLKSEGLLLLVMPSQGSFHRFPLDAFRFYPDAGTALEKWGQYCGVPIKLIESFTTPPKNDVWADFVAIFSFSPKIFEDCRIGGLLEGENWIFNGELQFDTYQEKPFELRKIQELEKVNSDTLEELLRMKGNLATILNSRSWRMTKPLRFVRSWFK